eukprot:325574-Pelagomonas_calceolata.AAC.1
MCIFFHEVDALCPEHLLLVPAGTVAAALKAASESTTAPPAAQQLGCRVAVNAFKHPQPRQWAVGERSGLLDTLAGAASSSNKHAGWRCIQQQQACWLALHPAAT